MYFSKIAESILRFVKVNRQELVRASPKQLISKKFSGILDEFVRNLTKPPELLHTANLANAKRVDLALTTLQDGMQMISAHYDISLLGITDLLEKVREPLNVLLDANATAARFRILLGKAEVFIPTNSSDLLLFSKKVEGKYWIQLVLSLAEPLLVIVQKARILGAKDCTFLKSIYTNKFERLYPKLL